MAEQTYFVDEMEDEATHSLPMPRSENPMNEKASSKGKAVLCTFGKGTVTCDGISVHLYPRLHLNTLWSNHRCWGCKLALKINKKN